MLIMLTICNFSSVCQIVEKRRQNYIALFDSILELVYYAPANFQSGPAVSLVGRKSRVQIYFLKI